MVQRKYIQTFMSHLRLFPLPNSALRMNGAFPMQGSNRFLRQNQALARLTVSLEATPHEALSSFILSYISLRLKLDDL